MNDATIMTLLGFAATIICVITPIIKLNTSITRLNVTLERFQQQTEDNHKNLTDRVTAHGKELDDHEGRITVVETVLKRVEKEGKNGKV